MGNAPSNQGRVPMSDGEKEMAFTLPHCVDFIESNKFCGDSLTRYSPHNKDDKDRKIARSKIKSKQFDGVEEDRAFGCFLGMPVGDALGAPLEFSEVRYGVSETKGMDDIEVWSAHNYNRFKLKPGQWTDDASMGFCMADSLIIKQDFDGIDMRIRFSNWWNFGYCNAFGWDEARLQEKFSVGLGGNISQSMEEFTEKQEEFTKAGDTDTSGNGSLMRLAAVPIFFHNDMDKAMEMSRRSSLTTHQGIEAAECCRLMTHIILIGAFYSIRLITKGLKGDGTPAFLKDLSTSFQSEVYSIQCLAASKQEDRCPANAKSELTDRNWNWQDPNYQYAPGRAKRQPGYIGSYAMDALSMALHCLHTTSNLKDAMLKSANIRGDSDTVTSICGQMAGAIYGCSQIPQIWIDEVLRWDPNNNIPLRAYKLFHHSLKSQQ